MGDTYALSIGPLENVIAWDSDGGWPGIRATNLTNPAAPPTLAYGNEDFVLKKDLPTGGSFDLGDLADVTIAAPQNNQALTYDSGSGHWVNETLVLGEANTASNIGVGGVGLFDAKVGVDLQFRNINAADAAISVALDAGNKEVDIGLVQANIDHTAIGNIGVNTHAQIDTHIAAAAIHFVQEDIDHGSIGGLADDDHTQYLRADGTRALTASWDAGSFDITCARLVAVGGNDIDLASDVPAAHGLRVSDGGGVSIYSADLSFDDGQKVRVDEVTARDADGLMLSEDGGTGIFIADLGDIYIKEAAASRELHAQVYSATLTHFGKLLFDKSASNTLGTEATTSANEYLGGIYWRGVDSALNKDYGAVIYARQNGAAAGYVPTRMFLYTFSGTGSNTNQLVLHNDGNIGIGTDSPAARVEIETTTTEGKAPLLLDQNDTDQPAIALEASSAADDSCTISTAAEASFEHSGHIRILVNGAVRWIPYRKCPL